MARAKARGRRVLELAAARVKRGHLQCARVDEQQRRLLATAAIVRDIVRKRGRVAQHRRRGRHAGEDARSIQRQERGYATLVIGDSEGVPRRMERHCGGPKAATPHVAEAGERRRPVLVRRVCRVVAHASGDLERRDRADLWVAHPVDAHLRDGVSVVARVGRGEKVYTASHVVPTPLDYEEVLDGDAGGRGRVQQIEHSGVVQSVHQDARLLVQRLTKTYCAWTRPLVPTSACRLLSLEPM
mmetsp:Transcript_33698/g.99066  ORF Transcript_33698/g.99066 Transcript_33698/m.99066 type:complete len:242 (+) Transcript_33698:222-947(+)